MFFQTVVAVELWGKILICFLLPGITNVHEYLRYGAQRVNAFFLLDKRFRENKFNFSFNLNFRREPVDLVEISTSWVRSITARGCAGLGIIKIATALNSTI